MEAMKLVNEEPYEINVDIYGIRDGPRLGRIRLQNKVGFSLCFNYDNEKFSSFSSY